MTAVLQLLVFLASAFAFACTFSEETDASTPDQQTPSSRSTSPSSIPTTIPTVAGPPCHNSRIEVSPRMRVGTGIHRWR